MTFMKNKPKPQAVTEAGVYPTQAAALRLVDRLMSGSVRAASVSRCAEEYEKAAFLQKRLLHR